MTRPRGPRTVRINKNLDQHFRAPESGIVCYIYIYFRLKVPSQTKIPGLISLFAEKKLGAIHRRSH